MRLRQRLQILVGPALAIIAAMSGNIAAAADEKNEAGASPTAYRQCRGVDMLDEMKSKDAARYEKVAAAAKLVENGEAIFWRIEKPGVAPSHILGTMHVSDPRITTLSEKASVALDTAQTMVLEVADLSQEAMMRAMMGSAELIVFTNGQRLDKMLGAADFARAQTLMQQAGLPGEMTALARPWIVATLLSVSECERQNIVGGHAPFDSKLGNLATARKIEVVGLETIEEQLAAMAAVPDAEQIEMLKAGLKFVHRRDDMLETLAQMYLQRRLGAAMPFNIALAESVGVKADAFKSFQAELIDRRNRRMFDGALNHVEKGSALIAVGALHLPGKTGLVQLFREAGYTVTPVE